MNTLKKFVAIVILITLILFFIHTFLKVEEFGTRLIEHNTVRTDPDDSTCADGEQNTEGIYMYNYDDVPNLSEYILKTEMPSQPDMSKYTLKTNLKPTPTPTPTPTTTTANTSSTTEERAVRSVRRVVKRTARQVAKPAKRVVKRVAKPVIKPVKQVAKTVEKPVKKVAEEAVKTVEKPASKIASELNKVVSDPTKIEPDADTRAKMKKTEARSDLVTKFNVTDLGKNTENGNEIVFKFDRILPDNLTYKKRDTKCIHSPVRGDDNSNEVPATKSYEELYKRVLDWFRKLF